MIENNFKLFIIYCGNESEDNWEFVRSSMHTQFVSIEINKSSDTLKKQLKNFKYLKLLL